MENNDANFDSLFERVVREESPRLRALARDLAGNGLDADDLVQETWIAAFRGAHIERSRTLGAWLAGILRNTARQARRSEDRRRRREAAVARHPEQAVPPGAPDWRGLHAAVAELREPYRSTITQRYLNGLGPQELACEEGISVRTVTTRTSRALEMLRTRLRSSDEEPPALFPAFFLWLVPCLRKWLGRHSPVAQRAAGIVWAPVFFALAVFVVLAVVGSGGGSLLGDPRVAPTAGLAPTKFASVGRSELVAPLTRAAGKRRRALEPVAERAVHSARSMRLVEGRVVDAVGNVRPRARVAFVPDDLLSGMFPGRVEGVPREQAPVENWISVWSRMRFTRADEQGTFQMSVAADVTGHVVALEDGHVPVVVERILEDVACHTILVVAPKRVLHGQVVDACGEPVVDAEVFLLRQPRWSTRIDGPRARIPHTRSDENGAFELASAFAAPHAFLRVRHPEYASAEHAPARFVRIEGAPDPRLVLEDPVAGETLRGRVFDSEGRPTSAVVSTGYGYVETDASGAFELAVPEVAPGVRFQLRAAACGASSPAASFEHFGDPHSIELRLTQEARDLHGMLVDRDGAPVENARVWILNPKPFGVGRRGAPREPGMPIFLESVLAGREPGLHPPATTDAGGRFHLEGLAARSYRLCILAPDGTLLEPPPVAAGSASLQLELPARAAHVLEGRVVGDRGRPIAGARITAVLARILVPIQWNDWWFRRDLVTVETLSDSDGRFRFTGLVGEVPLLTVTGTHLFPANDYRSEAGFEPPLELQVAERARLRLRSDVALSVHLLDAEGETLPIDGTNLGLFPVVGPAAHRRDLAPHTSAEWSIPSNAVEIVTFVNGEERDRVPLSVHAGGVAVVDL